MYKQATRDGLRIQTTKGPLSNEQLCGLSVNDLNDTAVSLDEEYEKSGKKSFLVSKSVKDKTAKLKLDIVLDILNTKVEEAEIAATKKANREHNQKILGLINEKKDGELAGKSIKQLTALLKEE